MHTYPTLILLYTISLTTSPTLTSYMPTRRIEARLIRVHHTLLLHTMFIVLLSLFSALHYHSFPFRITYHFYIFMYISNQPSSTLFSKTLCLKEN
jgi:hypothetical protein